MSDETNTQRALRNTIDSIADLETECETINDTIGNMRRYANKLWHQFQILEAEALRIGDSDIDTDALLVQLENAIDAMPDGSLSYVEATALFARIDALSVAVEVRFVCAAPDYPLPGEADD